MNAATRLSGALSTALLSIAIAAATACPAMAGDVWLTGKDIPLAPGEFTIGNSSSVVRTVTGKVDAGKRYLQYQDDIYREELIETYEDSATELTFLDESTLSLGPNSAVVLDRFVFNPESNANEFVLSITKGVLRFATGKLSSDSYEIHTPVSTIGVRGTVIDVAVGEGLNGTESMTLSVIEGEATVYACGDESLVVHEGFSSEITVVSESCSYQKPQAISALAQEP